MQEYLNRVKVYKQNEPQQAAPVAPTTNQTTMVKKVTEPFADKLKTQPVESSIAPPTNSKVMQNDTEAVKKLIKTTVHHLEKNLPLKAKTTAAAIEGALHNEEYFHHFKAKEPEPEPVEQAEEPEPPLPDLSIKNDDRAQQVENEILDQLKLEDQTLRDERAKWSQAEVAEAEKTQKQPEEKKVLSKLMDNIEDDLDKQQPATAECSSASDDSFELIPEF